MSFSASQIKLFRRCQRQWGREKIDRAPKAVFAKAELGKRGHSIAEAYLRDGTPPSTTEQIELAGRTYYPGRMVSRVLGHLPQAGTVPDVERNFALDLGGHDITGYVDWQTHDVVGDHKFTSSLNYAMNEKELAADEQAILYSEAKFRASDAHSLELRWVYGQFDAKAARKVSLRVLRDPERAKTLLPTLDAMALAHQTVTDARSLPKSLDACDAFGGCPHKVWCGPLSSTEIAQRTFARLPRAKSEGKVTQMGSVTIQDIIARRKAAATVQPTAVAVAGAINPPGEHIPTAAPVIAVPVVEPVVAVAVAEAPRKRGRPAKAANAAATIESAAKPALTLFVNCTATRGEFNVVDVFSSANEVVCKELSTAEREISHYSFVDYGKGPGALLIAVLAICDEVGSDFAIELDTRTPQGQACLVALQARASTVIRGV